ncbi:hypothetical protein NIM87_17130 [Devosia sp. XJ19-1]|uniref:Uncharacterized protein n=1 Tax=Devosia ureilytica TaxID=2952754 RepID=A0A9Q4AS66_9HYPH|nr:hypothetical protein [Devosia ureilytica]MCP8885235.1 hypothetical protein [Devosia ureilytica]MCP8888693.1 hypothetical protein [Devosia ureilytica]
MAQNHHHPGSLVPQETNFDNADTPGISQPFSQAEIEDLLYGEDRPVRERLERLREIRAEASARESGDFGDEDPASMIEALDRAIEELQGDSDNAAETGDASADMSNDPADHLDALSPDDIEAREALIGEDEFYEEDEDGPVDDETKWHGSEEFNPDLH